MPKLSNTTRCSDNGSPIPAKKAKLQKEKKKSKFIEDIENGALDFSSPTNLLSSLLINSNLSLEEFFEKHWEKELLVIKNAKKSEEGKLKDFRNYFSKLFSLDILQHIAMNFKLEHLIDACASRCAKGVKKTKKDLVLSVKGIRKTLAEGYTIQLHHPQRWCDELWKLQEGLECYFGSLVGSNIYITPQNSQGLAPHHDDVEVFVLQLQGSKQWSLYKPVEELPQECSGDLDVEEDNLVLIQQVLLEPGDILYMPRGLVHEAKVLPGSGTSVHLTVSTFQNNCWGTYLTDVVPDMIDGLMSTEKDLRLGVSPARYREKTFKKELSNKLEKTFELLKKQLEDSDSELPFDDISVDYFASRLPPFCKDEQNSVQDSSIAISDEMQVRFKYPLHIHIMEAFEKDNEEDSEDEDSEDEEEEVEDEGVFVYYSSQNDRTTHMVGSKKEPQRLRYPHRFLKALKLIHGNGSNFTCISDISESTKPDFKEMCKDLQERNLLQIKL